MSSNRFITPVARCPHCRAFLDFGEESFVKRAARYFERHPNDCPSCDGRFDWWEVALREIRTGTGFFFALGPVGAKLRDLSITLRDHQTERVRFEDYGLPPEGKLLFVNYSPQGQGRRDWDLAPVDTLGSQRNARKYGIPREVLLWSRCRPGSQSDKMDLAVMFGFVENSEDDLARRQLTDAFEAYANGALREALIPANESMEIRLGDVLRGLLLEVASKEKVERFLTDGATYSH